jgi:hypothetical protein
LTTHGFPLSEHQTELISLVYGDENYAIKYAEFLADCNVLVFIVNGPYTGAKSTYNARFTDFNGSQEMVNLMDKIKNIIKRDRIRMLEFFQDHDMLRKGSIEPTKFRSTLHG